jgi:hypothetical protein
MKKFTKKVTLVFHHFAASGYPGRQVRQAGIFAECKGVKRTARKEWEQF